MRLLEIIGILASVLGLLLSLISVCQRRFKLLALLIFVMTLVLAITFYRYTLLADDKIREVERREDAKKEATKLLESIPITIYDYQVGQNTAIVYQTLFYLEKYNDLFPITATSYKDNVLIKMDKAEQESFDYDRRQSIRECAESAKQILVSMSDISK